MANVFPCPIWGTPAKQIATAADGGVKVFSYYTDGEYRLSGSASALIGQLGPEQKARLTTWIVDQHRMGERAPLVSTHTLDEVALRRDLRMSERKKRFLLLTLSRDFQPSSYFRASGANDERFHTDVGAIYAWTECREYADVNGILNFLKQEDLISYAQGIVSLTSKGFHAMEALQFGGAATNQAFVAMWFDPSMDEPYAAAAKAIEEAGYSPMRIDRKEHGNKIDDEIIAEIRASRFLVADFTCGLVRDGDTAIGVARGGVYYEAGFAQGLNMPVIWTCREDCIGYVHFDTRQYNHIVWKTPEELRERLRVRIRAMIV